MSRYRIALRDGSYLSTEVSDFGYSQDLPDFLVFYSGDDMDALPIYFIKSEDIIYIKRIDDETTVRINHDNNSKIGG